MVQEDQFKSSPDTAAFDHRDGKARSAVRLPDFFVSFLTVKPTVNPHYQHVKQESEEWISTKCNFDEKQRDQVTKTDFSYFCAMMVPDAGADELRTVCDWGNWVFPFDDMFDCGPLKGNFAGAHAEMDELLAAIRSPETYDRQTKGINPLVETHNSVWFRVLERATKGASQRFASAMRDYREGVLAQFEDWGQGIVPDIDTYLTTRRKSVGVTPLLALVEYAYALDIPDDIFECHAIREIGRVAADFVVLTNDALSYPKERDDGHKHNLVAIYRLSGLSAQAAYDKVDEQLRLRYRDWYLAMAALPQWGEKIDRKVQTYIQGAQNLVRAHLYWSFKSYRYLGQKKDAVRANRLIDVVAD